jgi:hypothetical protein
MFEKMFVTETVSVVLTRKVTVFIVSLLQAPVNLAVTTPPPPPGALGRTLLFRGLLADSYAWTVLAILCASDFRNVTVSSPEFGTLDFATDHLWVYEIRLYIRISRRGRARQQRELSDKRSHGIDAERQHLRRLPRRLGSTGKIKRDGLRDRLAAGVDFHSL